MTLAILKKDDFNIIDSQLELLSWNLEFITVKLAGGRIISNQACINVGF